MELSKDDLNENLLYSDPYVACFNNILSDDECQHFINISKDKLKRSLVCEHNNGVISSGRTSSNTWIKHDHDDITKKVGERIAKIVGMPLENAEAYQIIYYGTREEYRNHYDSWLHDGSEKTLRCMKYGGARVKTVLCYLNNVHKGGGTKMTKLHITIPAEKGKLLVFHNTVSEKDHTRHELSEHAGLPVEEGEKFAFNLWFKECNSKMLYKEFNPNYYNKVDITEKTVEETVEETTEKTVEETNVIIVDALPETLQVGDYFPFIEITGINKKKHIHNFCNHKPFMIITAKNLVDINLNNRLQTLSSQYNIIILYKDGEPNNTEVTILYTKDVQLQKMLLIKDEPVYYMTTPNRRIISIVNNENIDHLTYNDYLPKEPHIPYLLIENALDKALLKKVIHFYDKQKDAGKLIAHQHSTKDRQHVHPDAMLEREIDHKLSRSVLPELRKVFYFDAQYRETYKICSYDGETSGRFHAHRDTPAPYQHRKYALSLFLNDDYEGGEFVLPEYGLKIKPTANTAFIFPGISTHQVLPVTKGSRMTIITFFVNGATKPHYKMKAHYFKDKKIVDSQIYPL